MSKSALWAFSCIEADNLTRPYVTCTLYHPDEKGKPEKKKTSAYRIHAHKKLIGHSQPPTTSPIWSPPEKLIWSYEENDFAFLRVLVKSDDAFARNPVFLASAVRLISIPEGALYDLLRCNRV